MQQPGVFFTTWQAKILEPLSIEEAISYNTLCYTADGPTDKTGDYQNKG